MDISVVGTAVMSAVFASVIIVHAEPAKVADPNGIAALMFCEVSINSKE